MTPKEDVEPREYLFNLFCVQARAIQKYQASSERCYMDPQQQLEDDGVHYITQDGAIEGTQSETTSHVPLTLSEEAMQFGKIVDVYDKMQEQIWTAHVVPLQPSRYSQEEFHYLDASAQEQVIQGQAQGTEQVREQDHERARDAHQDHIQALDKSPQGQEQEGQGQEPTAESQVSMDQSEEEHVQRKQELQHIEPRSAETSINESEQPKIETSEVTTTETSQIPVKFEAIKTEDTGSVQQQTTDRERADDRQTEQPQPTQPSVGQLGTDMKRENTSDRSEEVRPTAEELLTQFKEEPKIDAQKAASNVPTLPPHQTAKPIPQKVRRGKKEANTEQPTSPSKEHPQQQQLQQNNKQKTPQPVAILSRNNTQQQQQQQLQQQQQQLQQLQQLQNQLLQQPQQTKDDGILQNLSQIPNVASTNSNLNAVALEDLRRVENNIVTSIILCRSLFFLWHCSEMDRLMVQQLDKMYARLDKERQERDKLEKERQERLLTVVSALSIEFSYSFHHDSKISQTLNTSIQTQLERVVRKETHAALEKLGKDLETAVLRTVNESVKKSMQGTAPKTEALYKDVLSQSLGQLRFIFSSS